ncbi:MAG: ABC transporter permease [Deltaproteobacteria bacterium]|jgi:ABC-2 type transport system permease protein|nr:ABC transporter permease [Deltaproteobacteria bacterium]MBW2535722.1 ABC transporter permease [Deltaproteobacteria bacterium]
MSPVRVLSLVGKDLAIGPRSPVLIWVLLMPALITFLLQVVLLSLFEGKPRLALVDQGQSQISAAVEAMDDIELARPTTPDALRAAVRSHDVDAGLVLPRGFDAAVRAGQRPELELYVSGESLASNRLVLAVVAIDLVRAVENRPAPVRVEIEDVGGGEMLPIDDIIVISIMLFVLLMTGVFAPAFLLVEERERRTLHALLVTPVTMTEVLVAKALLGFVLAMGMSVLTLALNGALSADPVALLACLAVATITCNLIGLVYASLAKDAKTLYSLTKSFNVVLVAPLFFYLFPTWPQWIAKLFPTYWFIDPLYRVALEGAPLGDVGLDLLVALGVCAVLLLAAAVLGRRLHAKLV